MDNLLGIRAEFTTPSRKKWKRIGKTRDSNELTISRVVLKELGQKYQDMNPNFLVLLPPNIHQYTGKYRLLYPLQTTAVSNHFLASFEPECQSNQIYS